MGVANSKHCDCQTSKKLKLGFNANNSSLQNSDPSNQASPFRYSDWENLPLDALAEIYTYLSDKDKLNLSMTCRAWSRAFSMPAVWRHAKFYFNGRDDKRALHISGTLAHAVRHLAIDCRDTMNSIEHPAGVSTTNLYNFLKGLQECQGCRLVTLRLINMERLSWWNQLASTQDILTVLAEILAIQTNLKLVDLTRAGFPPGQGLYILSRLACCSGSKITELSISGFFSNIVTPSIANQLQSFTSLTELTLSYEYITDTALKVLAGSGSLISLSIYAREITKVPPPSNDAWETLKTSRPSLEARFYINKDLGTTVILKSILSPAIPLVALEFSWLDPRFYWNVISQHIASNFQGHLRRLDVELCGTMYWAENVLDVFIKRCLELEELHVTTRGDNVALQVPLKRSVRRAVYRQRASNLSRFTMDGVEVKLNMSSAGFLIDWVKEKIG